MSETSDRIYAIQHDGYELYAGRAANQQVLIAPAGFSVAALFFDADGALVETKQIQLPRSIPSYDYAAWGRASRHEMERYAREIGFAPQTIHLRRFQAPEVGLRIEDPTAHIAEARRDLQLGQRPAAELALLARDVADWEAEGLFVLRLDSRELWMNGQGEVHST
jgi:hypothetical protein